MNANNKSTASPSGIPAAAFRVQIALLLVSLIGLGVAMELTHIHYESHTNPDFKSICAINEALNCETVARSPWSVFAELPISVWGMFAYLLFIVLGVYQLVKKISLSGFYVVALSGAVIASAILAYISTFEIKSLCLFCTTLYVVNTTLFILGIVLLRIHRTSPVQAVRSDFRQVISNISFFLPLAIVLGAGIAAVYLLLPPYWRTSSFDSLPPLDSGITEDGHHWIGAKSPVITITEFSDYECPFCRRAHYNIRMMVARYKDRIRLIHWHMPMDNKCNEYLSAAFHERACEFARAVECAGDQDKFWQMNDQIFGAQETRKAADVNLPEIVDTLKINPDKFEDCMQSADPAKRIGNDIDEGTRRKLPGTPTYFIGAQPYPGGIPEETIHNLLKRHPVSAPTAN
jgi:uncharacterized membrane protein/protein-disulfide isomerase